MTAHDYSLPIAKANLYVLAMSLPLVFLLASFFTWVWGIQRMWEGLRSFGRLGVFFPVLIFGIVVHELIHGASWAYFSRKPFKVIKFGFQIKSLTPYAHYREPILVSAYRLGALMPGLLMGIAPFVISILIGNGWLMAFGMLFTFTAGGDLLILWLLRSVPKYTFVSDHPSRVGCTIFDGDAKM